MPSSPASSSLLDVLQRRRAQIVVADQRAHARGLGRQRQLARVRGGQRQRLLAIDVLAGRDRRQRHLLVQDVGRGDRDQPHRRVGDQLAPVGAGAGEAEAVARPLGRGGVDVGHHLQPRPQLRLEQRHHRGEGQRVALAHEAGADDPDADLAHAGSPDPYRMPCLASSITLAASALVTKPGPVG